MEVNKIHVIVNVLIRTNVISKLFYGFYGNLSIGERI